ncbi:hypothetical protein ILUMI_09098 [Ignelater luminosus]|uniref:C2H2-type domain-containing protein n=1 Tax=Ignelater luminosus TaxID=2038154 RepID=A0A8K0D4I7_IGNLU|nr:hypothetical protein ILUMI_09098 [Ignelater luminosus]
MTSVNHSVIENGSIKFIDVGSDILQLKNNEEEYNLNIQGGTPTIFVQQGQYVIPVGGHAVILQDDQGDFEQYIINNVVTDEDTQETDEIQEVVGQPIIYYSGEFTDQSEVFEDGGDSSENTNIVDEVVEDESNAIVKHFKLESNYIQNYQDEQTNDDSSIENNFLQVQDETGTDKIIIATNEQQQPQYQYAILKNGKLHLQTLDIVDAVHCSIENNEQNQQLQERLEAFQQSITMDDAPSATSTVDLDKITGRNLITGQTVTLDSYFDKLQRRLAAADVTNQCLTYNTKKRRRTNSFQESQSVNKKVNKNSTPNESFINKKIIVGKTSNGKRIVGKIVRVEVGGKKDENICTEETQSTEAEISNTKIVQNDQVGSEMTSYISNVSLTTDENKDLGLIADSQDVSSKLSVLNWDSQDESTVQPQIIIKKHLVTRENFDYNIGKTLAGLMDMETVQRSLQNKNLVVKLVEKTYDRNADEFNRTVSYVYGHMELIQCDIENPDSQQWTFVLHNGNSNITKENGDNNGNINENGSEEQVSSSMNEKQEEEINHDSDIIAASGNEEIRDDDCDADEGRDALEMEDVWAPYDETASVTITITVDKNGKKSTRVNLSPQQSESRCSICNKEFKTGIQMRKHRHRKIHATDERWYQCPQCSKSFNTAGSLKRHLTVHDPSLRPLECSVCAQRFTDESSLRKHLLIHTGIRAYTCDICSRAFVNQGDLNFHRRIHDPVKQYRCEVCGQEFSRHSNLVRHAEIHRGAGALHRCDICGCSYSFVSSLTRHIVQKHINQPQQQ